jgi:hypothetical protein
MQPRAVWQPHASSSAQASQDTPSINNLSPCTCCTCCMCFSSVAGEPVQRCSRCGHTCKSCVLSLWYYMPAAACCQSSIRDKTTCAAGTGQQSSPVTGHLHATAVQYHARPLPSPTPDTHQELDLAWLTGCTILCCWLAQRCSHAAQQCCDHGATRAQGRQQCLHNAAAATTAPALLQPPQRQHCCSHHSAPTALLPQLSSKACPQTPQLTRLVARCQSQAPQHSSL